jgi:predicted PurR-regulated permease PerM
MENLENLPAVVQIVLAVLLVVWLVLLLLVPFMIESIRNSSRKTRAELERLNQKVDELIEILDRTGPSAARPGEPRAQHTERARKEPTISG